jgi:BMFP domain-containing protein YqiC
MPPSNRLFDDLARLMTDAAGAAQGVRREAETVVRAQVERLIRDLDVASREEVDVLRDLVTSLRTQNEALAARVAALEAKFDAKSDAKSGPVAGAAAGLSEGA